MHALYAAAVRQAAGAVARGGRGAPRRARAVREGRGQAGARRGAQAPQGDPRAAAPGGGPARGRPRRRRRSHPGPWAGALREAIEKRVETTLEYRAVADATAEKRVVEPRLLFQRDGQWYLAAWNVAKEAEHLFRLDRIVTVELGTRVFGEHKGPPVARYAKRSLYFESGAEREVTLRFQRQRRPGSRASGTGPGRARTRTGR